MDGNIDIYDLENQPNNVLTLTGSTDGAANTFAYPRELSGLQFPSSDIIYEMVIEVGEHSIYFLIFVQEQILMPLSELYKRHL